LWVTPEYASNNGVGGRLIGSLNDIFRSL
jgi:hypothetical protein